MSALTNWMLRFLQPAAAAVGMLVAWCSPGNAYVNQIVIDATSIVNLTPTPLGTSTVGASTSYTIYQGRIFGYLDPNDSHNSGITDIQLSSSSGFSSAAPSGKAQYVANFQILTPTDPTQRNGLLIHEVPNRGGNAIPAIPVQGATYVQSGWQPDLLSQCAGANPVPLYPCFPLSTSPYGTLSSAGAFAPPVVGTSTLASYVVQVPVATTDGKPAPGYTGNTSNNIITGTVYSHICIGTNGCGLAVGTKTPTSVMQVQAAGGAGYEPYLPAGYLPSNPAGTLSASVGNLWTTTSQTFQGVEGPKTTVANWTWSNCPSGPGGTPNPYFVCLGSGNFDPTLLYEMTYTAQNPLVLGVGFAAFRDLASFLRYGTTAPGGGSNPVAGTITKTYTVGASQSGAFIHSFIFYGFNQDESNRIVFDGAWPQIDARMMVMNLRFAAPNDLMYLYRGGDESPVWWADYPNLARNLPPNGMLHRCNETHTCPQILETFGAGEMYSEKLSVSLCGFTCVTDIPIPSNVHRYYSPGATHGGGTVSFNWTSPTAITIPAGQSLANDPIPETYTNNALQYAFIQLVLNGTAMPPSVYPTLARRELVLNTQAAEGFPNVPGFPFEGNQAWPPFVYDFGPNESYSNESGIPTIQPPTIRKVLPVYVPVVDADGNENVTALPTVLGSAPLGTYTGWNLATTGWFGPNASNGPGSVGQVFAGAGNSGGFYPFWDTKANRTTAGDPRLSLEERYGSHTGYNCVVRQAANKAVEQRFLLTSDATTLTTMASAGNVLASLTPTTADQGVANVKCEFTTTHGFTSSAHSDILWRDIFGDVAIWSMNGATISAATLVGNLPNNWTVAGQHDFNGDGSADVLWRDTAGDVGIWLMNGTKVTEAAVIANVPTDWRIVGTGDFNGDGKSDILWRDSGGDIAITLMNGTTIISSAIVGTVPTTWTIAGTGDFNGDGMTDILWRDSSGNVGISLMNGTTVTSTTVVGNIPTNWVIVGTGDFNSDGKSDVLWRDGTGDVAITLMNGATISTTAVVGQVPNNWSIAETGDFNGDGMSDILLRDHFGNVGVWLMNGTTVSKAASIGSAPTFWAIQTANAD
jgi:hypothetical protein